MNRNKLIEIIKQRKSLLCVGLDPDFDLIPNHLKENKDWIFDFNKAIIDSTKDLCVAYKPNLAFYEKYYAQSFFENTTCDAVTVSPYMGSDSIEPFLTYKDKWAVILTLTSNPGSKDLQLTEVNDKLTIGRSDIQNRQCWMKLFEHVSFQIKEWGTSDNTMLVVGATKADYFQKIRKIVPDHFLLVPGVGTQGGNLDVVLENGLNSDFGLLINVGRDVIYSGSGQDFDTKARERSIVYQTLMEKTLKDKKLI
jgi:orotidine-5'-phosphate decarboxylase